MRTRHVLAAACAVAVAAAGGTAAHAADRCSRPGAHVLRQTAQAKLLVVRSKGDTPRRFYGCLRGHAPSLLAEDYNPHDVDAGEFNEGFLLAGRTVAWHEFDFDGSGFGSRSFSVHLLTLGGGRHADFRTYDDDNGPLYGYPQQLALAADGTLVWALELNDDNEDFLQTGSEILALPAGSSRLVGLGFASDLAVKTLRVANGRATWREKDGTRHSAIVRRAQPPLSPRPAGRAVGGQGFDPRFDGCGYRDVSVEHETEPAVLAAVAGGGVLAAVGTSDAIVARRFTADGAPDPAFGTGGTVTDTLPPMGSAKPDGVYLARAIGLPDGAVVVKGGQNFVNGGRSIHRTLLARLTATGQLDPAFGQGGIVRGLPLPGGDDQILDVAAAPDGGLIAATGSGGHILRIRPDGTADPAFGSGGGAYVPLITPSAVAVAPDGTITVAGAGNDTIVVVRYSPSGARLSTAVAQLPGRVDFGALAQLADGAVIVAGSVSSFASDAAVYLRFTAAGKLDTAFGRAGVADDRSVRAVNGLLPEADGGWLATAKNGLARYTPDGRRDRSFGRAGLLRDPAGGFADPVPGPEGTVFAAPGRASALIRFAVADPAVSAVATTAPACDFQRNTHLVGAKSTTNRVHVNAFLLRPGTYVFSATLLIGSRTYALGAATLFFDALDGYDLHWDVGRTARQALARARRADVRVTLGAPGGPSSTGTIRLKG